MILPPLGRGWGLLCVPPKDEVLPTNWTGMIGYDGFNFVMFWESRGVLPKPSKNS